MSGERRQTVFRRAHESRFTTFGNDLLRNPSLSLRARGLLQALLSFPTDWKFNMKHIYTLSEPDGETAIKSTVKELVKAGYIVRREVRDRGRIVRHEMLVYEVPFSDEEGQTNDEMRFSTTVKAPSGETPPTKKERTTKTYLNPLSSRDDGDPDLPSSAIKEKRSSSSPRTDSPSPRKKAPSRNFNDQLEKLVPLIAKAWNENCGSLPKLRNDTVPQSYLANTKRFVRELLAEDLDPVEAITLVARAVAENDWYRTKGNFGNAMAAGNWRKHYDTAVAHASPTDGGTVLPIGSRVSWPRRAGYPHLGRITGVLIKYDERGVPWMEVDAGQPGINYSSTPVAPGLLKLEP